MTSLASLQRQFISDCLSGELSNKNIALEGSINTESISAKGLMGIYRESAIANIIIPMQITYPVVEKLVGAEFFRATCRLYIKKHWPDSGNMDDYGQEFSVFLSQFEHVKELPYLSEVAKLEWLVHQSSVADEVKQADWAKFDDLSEDQVAEVRITLHPAVQLGCFTHPVGKIWNMNQTESEQEEVLLLAEEEESYIIVYRESLKTTVKVIPEEEYSFLYSMLQGEGLYVAAEKAFLVNQEINLQEIMSKYLSTGVMSRYTTD